MSAKLPTAICEAAAREVGVEELHGSNSGPRVMAYQAATDLGGTGWPWCAAFVCFVVREAMRNTGTTETATFHRPTTPGAWALIPWSLEQDDSTSTLRSPGDDIRPGDILVYTFSHVGIAVEAPEHGYVATIEGNTDGEGSREGGAVLHKRRRLAQVKARIRFTV